MSRFANEQPASLTTITKPATLDAELAQPERQRWYRWRIDSAVSKEKKGSTEEIDYVEEVDGVWGKLGEGGPNYRNVGWLTNAVKDESDDASLVWICGTGAIKSAAFLVNLQIGIGVLALPNTLHAIGMIPGIICIIASGLITTWGDTVIGLFKRGHPQVYSVSDVGMIMGGRLGQELLGGMYWIFCVLCGAGQVLAFSTAMNAVTLHAACTIAWVVICSALGIAIGMIRTLDKISWTNWVGLASLMIALITAAAACAVQDRPALAPIGEPLFLDVRLFHNPGFLPGVQAGTNIILAFTGGPAFYNVLSEMKNPKDFNKSVFFAQSWVTTTYLVISCVIYASVGRYIDSPALGSAGPLMKRVCYGIVLPGLIIGAVLYIHIPAKYVFVRALRNTRHLTESTWQHWTAWTSCVVGTGVLAFIFSLAIPVFNDLLTLMSALCGTPLAVTLPATMWIYETRRTRSSSERGLKWWIGVAVCLVLIGLSLFIAVAGTIAAVVSLNTAVQNGEAHPFSCADNSNSV